MTQEIRVDHQMLGQLLRALTGPGHLIREIQATVNLPDLSLGSNEEHRNPLRVLIDQFNDPTRVIKNDEQEPLPPQPPTQIKEAFVTGLSVLPPPPAEPVIPYAANCRPLLTKQPQIHPTSDPKYSIVNNQLVVTATLRPLTNPIFIFRAEDRHLPTVLHFYSERLRNPVHYDLVMSQCKYIEQWQRSHEYLLKEPDTAPSPPQQTGVN